MWKIMLPEGFLFFSFLIYSYVVATSGAPSFSCDFSSGPCSYELPTEKQTFKWQLYHHGNSDNTMYTYSDPSSHFMKGAFLYIAAKPDQSESDGSELSIVSSTYKVPTGSRCHKIKYRMFGAHAGRLTISLVDESGTLDLIDKTGNQGEDWHEINMNIDYAESVRTQLQIKAVRGPRFHGEIAVDEVLDTRGECPHEKDSPSCSFEFLTCGWGDFNRVWKHASGAHEAFPQLDHTTGTPYGSYGKVKLDLSRESRYTMSPSNAVPNGKHKCFRFRYYLEEGAVLHAGIAASGRKKSFSWKSRDSDPRHKWLLGETSVYGENGRNKLIFEASKQKGVKETFVAIDDITLRDGDCPRRGNNFFEDGFDLYSNDENSDFEWLVTSSENFKDIDINDHSYETKTGHYALAFFQDDEEGQKARLMSPTFLRNEVSCLEFSYHISSKTNGFLTLLVGHQMEQTIIASTVAKELDSDVWHSIILPLEVEEEKFQIVFEATAGGDSSGFIAIDDIIVSDTSCIAKYHQIDWSSPVPEHVSSAFDCNFENLTLCLWEQITDSDLNLTVFEIGETSNDWDPETDHTGQVNGSAFGVASSEPTTGRGGLMSPIIPGSSRGHCLSFWYWLQGRGVSLKVFISHVGQPNTLLWQRTMDEGAGWQWAELTIPDELELQFRFAMKKLSTSGSIMLDDIWYSPSSCRTRSLTLTDTCDFESGLCGFSTLSSDVDQWTVSSGEWSGPVSWHQKDSTYQTDQGHFLLYNQSEAVSDSVAIIESPLLTLSSEGEETCVHFHYFLAGPEVGTLELSTVSTESYEDIQWTSSGNHGEQWLPAEIQLGFHESAEMYIEFKAIAGPGPLGLIGVDDVAVRQGKCASPGSCGFDHQHICTWRYDPSLERNSWRMFRGNHLSFKTDMSNPDSETKGTIISEMFTRNQARCIHFEWTHIKGGNGSLSLSLVPVDKKEQSQLLWQLTMNGSEETTDKNTWKKGRVTLDSNLNYEVYLTVEAFSGIYHVMLDNILITNQQCLAEPPEAVSLNCDFTEGTGFWYQDATDDADWIISSVAPQPFARLLPVFTNDEAVARLHSPLIPAGDRCLKFTYFMNGADVGHLKVFMDIGHKRIPYVDWRGGDAEQRWHQATVDLRNDNNYQLVLEGMCVEGQSCSVGIANVEVSVSSCPDSWRSATGSPHCTFESHNDPLCHFAVHPSQHLETYAWTREGGLEKSDPNAPQLDFTFGFSGHYAYVAPPSETETHTLTTKLVSQTLHSYKDTPYCMIFAYYMEGKESGVLSVYQVVPGEEVSTPIWSADISDNIWEKGFVTLQEMDAFQVMFEASSKKKTPATKGLAVDEIFLTRGPCKEWSDMCGFTDDMCQWTNVVDGSDAFDWERRHHELSLNDGPQTDRTQMSTRGGHYLLAGSLFGSRRDNAKLHSEMHFPTEEGADMCVNFFYFMSGKGSVALRVSLLQGFESSQTHTSLALWSLETRQTERTQWLKAAVSVDRRYTTQLFKIEFEAIIVDGGVAIDDVQILSEKCRMFPDTAQTQESALDLASCSFNDDSLCGWHNKGASHWKLETYRNTVTFPRRLTDNRRGGGFACTEGEQETGGSSQHVLTSPILPPTDGVDCLRFWFYTSSEESDSLSLTTSIEDTRVVLWHGDASYTWREISVPIHNDNPFQLNFETNVGAHALEDIRLSHGVCRRKVICHFVNQEWCGYTQDDTDDFDWEQSSARRIGISPIIQREGGERKARIKSPVYAGGGAECLEFSLYMPQRPSGLLAVYAQELTSTDLGERLWEMSHVRTLEVSVKRLVQVPLHIVNPFRVVFEFTLEVENSQTPLLEYVRLNPYACEPLGSCDFEDGVCTYTTGSQRDQWKRLSHSFPPSKIHPITDHTSSSPDGYFMAADFRSWSSDALLELESTILPKTEKSCLTFAYALLNTARLSVVMRIDDSGPHTVHSLTDGVQYGQQVTWRKAQLDIQADQSFILSFQATSETVLSGQASTVSLDDIQLFPGSCADQATPAPTTLQPIQSIIEDFSCNFESTSKPFCKYVQGGHSNGYWQRTYGSWNSSGLGFDHTRQDGQGVFASLVSISDSDPASANLEVLSTLSDTPQCLSFWYHIAGSPDNTLRFYTTGESPLWEKSNEQDLVWQHAVVDLDIETDNVTDVSPRKSFFAFKFEGTLQKRDGHVALDDIEIYSGDCSAPENGVCKFEEDGLCDFNQDNHNAYHWERVKAGQDEEVEEAQASQPFSLTDHTYGTSKGHFMFCCSSPTETKDTSSMLSPIYKANPKGRCLIFWYKRTFGVLQVLMRDKEGHTRHIFKVDTTQETWKIAHVNIRSRFDFQVVFEVQRAYSEPEKFTGEIGVDDIQMSPGPCHELYGCDFARDFCTWTQYIQGNAEWRITSGNPPPGQALIGPAKDHSTNSAAGQYILLQGSLNGLYADVTTLTSQVIYLPGRHLPRTLVCFSFWYHMSDSSAGSITVSTTGSDHTWGPFSHNEAGWFHEQMSIPVPNDNTDMQISVLTTILPGRENYIALDDLELIGQPCTKVQHTRKFGCRDGTKTMVPYEKMCDFVSDCENGFDEQQCSSCSFDVSWCRFVRVDGDQYGWRRIEGSSNNILANGAYGDFVGISGSTALPGSLETGNTYRMASPSCTLRFRLNIIAEDGKPPEFKVKVMTHHEEYIIYQTSSPTIGWSSTEVLVGNINVPFQIAIDAVTNGESNAVGFDDYELTDCGFPETKDSCAEDQFTCGNKVCISLYKVCDFSNDCGDFSDETGCDDTMRNDFEYSLGDWRLDDAGEDKWVIQPSPRHDITRDHTPGAVKGKFIYPQHWGYNEFDGSDQTSAFIVSPVLKPTDPDRNPCQLSFFFMVTDAEHHVINVYTKAASSGTLSQVDYSTSKHGTWTRAVISLSQSVDFQVVLEGVNWQGDNWMKVKVAVDDLSFSQSCQRSQGTVDPASIQREIEDLTSVTVSSTGTTVATTATTTRTSTATTTTRTSAATTTRTISTATTTTTTSKSADTSIPDKPSEVRETTVRHGKEGKLTTALLTSSTSGPTTLVTEDVTTTTEKTLRFWQQSKHDTIRDDEDSDPPFNDQKNQKNKTWKVSVGVSMGLIGLGIIVIAVAIYLKRFNRTLFFGSTQPREVGFANKLYSNDVDLEEVPGVGFGISDHTESGQKPRSRSFENPTYEEHSA